MEKRRYEDGTIDGLKENDLIRLVEKTCPNFKTEGLTIEQLQNSLLGGPKEFEIIRPIKQKEIGAQDTEDQPRIMASVNEFKNILIHEIKEYGGIILNYDMSTLGQVPGRGHFSLAVAIAKPISGDGKQDYLLLLDPWPETPIAWVPVEAMFKAMQTIDVATGKYRGCLIRKN